MDTAQRRPRARATSLFIAGDDSVAGAISTLLALDEPCGTCISSAPPAIATLHPQNPALLYLVDPLGMQGAPARILTPPPRRRMIIPRPGELLFYDLTKRGSRLGKVGYARALFDSEMLFACIDGDRLAGADPDVAIGLWRHFVWNWARIGKFLGDEGAGLIAELALGVTARRYYLTVTNEGNAVALATSDPIVAELAGRAVLRLRASRLDDTARGPWEHAVVQRAGELDLGVRTPEQIQLRATWSGSPANSEKFASFIERFADLLSITIESGH